MASADVAAASLWATVPGYTAQIPSPKACEALMRTACSMIGTTVPAGAFTRAIADYEARVAALVADDEDLASYVTRLESMMDEVDDDADEDDDDTDDVTAEVDRFDGDEEVDPEQFLAEVERFLRDAGPSGDEGPAPEGDG